MPARSVQKPYTVTLKRVVEIEITQHGTSAADVRDQLSGWDMDDLQHEGNIVSDECKIARVQPK